MELKDTGITETTDFLKSTDPVRMCLHGAMYDVHWNVKEKPESPADNFSEILQYEVMPATAVGTSPMDTLITYITARKGHEKDEDIKRLEEGILAIESLSVACRVRSRKFIGTKLRLAWCFRSDQTYTRHGDNVLWS